MGVLDFLFEGKPPPSVTTYGNSTESIPKWLSDYTQGIIARANSVAGEGYQTYGGPRIAGFTQDQNRGFDLTRQSTGSYKPGMDLARSFEEQAGGMSTMDAAQPYMQGAGQKFTEGYQDYLNPYTDDVITKAQNDATDYYTDTITPMLNKQFTAAGQYGSSQHEREALREGAKLTRQIQDTSNAARARGFETAGSLFGADADRQGMLANLSGQLTGADAQIKGQAGRDLAALQQAETGMGRADRAELATIGAQQQQQNQSNLDLAYGDFQDQRDYDRDQVDWLNSLTTGMPYDRTKTSTEKGPLGNQYQPSTFSSILSGLTGIQGLFGKDGEGLGGLLSRGWDGLKGIFGGGGGDSGGGGGGIDLGSIFGGYKDGGKVKVQSIIDMMADLRSKRRPAVIEGEYSVLDGPGYGS